LGSELLKCLLLVTYTFLQRLLFGEADEAALSGRQPRAISNRGYGTATITTKMRSEIIIGTEIGIVSLSCFF